MLSNAINHTVVDRFLKYVTYDTQSREGSDSYPSTDKQKILGAVLVEELKAMGLKNAAMDKYGYVMATLPANTKKPVPAIGLIAHMDTSPDVSGKDVKPIVHKNYMGGDIVLPGDLSQVLRETDNPALAEQKGNDIITSDGTTLLGADNKAGIAEIFDAVHYFIEHPDEEHGKICIAITPDEEIGEGTKYFDTKKFGAEFAYTIDGESAGYVENETFSADSVTLRIHGNNVHPGYAKDKMINAIKIMAEIIDQLPKDKLSPETTESREGYIHPNSIAGGVENTSVKFLIRDFRVEGLERLEQTLRTIANNVLEKYPGATMDFEVEESYRNMKYKLDHAPHVVENALEAVRRAGLKPVLHMIRGGTDGARLSFEGLPTPNIFTGGHNFHSKIEWISVQDMKKAVETIIHIVKLTAERA
ncbi:peptidase T [candidate division KSB1 bacterium]|nr:peptidase T [candidate division KSB1 bacterium]